MQAAPAIKNSAIQTATQFLSKQTAAMAGAKLLATLADTRIKESSGIAASSLNKNVLWLHNDSGDGPHVFAIDLQSHTLARYTVSQATNVDWEDMAIGPTANGKSALFIGDIGDNHQSREDTVVYRVPEPIVDLEKTMQESKTAPAEKLPFRYPDGPHNAEVLLVHPTTGAVLIVTKSGDGNSGVYAFPLPLQPGRQVTLKKIGEIKFTTLLWAGLYGEAKRSVTGGAISPDGRHLILRTYLDAFEWDIAPRQSVAEVLTGKRYKRQIPFVRLGEAICYRSDSQALLLTSEGTPTPLYEVPRR